MTVLDRRTPGTQTACLNLYLVRHNVRPELLNVDGETPVFRSAVVAASTKEEARGLADGWAQRNQWDWHDDQIAVKRLAAMPKITRERVLCAESA